jgi:hypothetical protein
MLNTFALGFTVRQAVAFFLSFSLVAPAFSANNYDYSNDSYNFPSYSYNTFDRSQQMAAYRVASFAQQSYTIPMRSPVQFPKFNLDFTFQTTFSSPKLDLGRASFVQPRFDARPVVRFDQKYSSLNNYKGTESPQTLGQTSVASFKNDNLKMTDSVLSLNKNMDLGSDLKSKSITPPLQASIASQPTKSRMLDLVPQSLGRFYGISDRQMPVAPQPTDTTRSLRPSAPIRIFNAVASAIKAVPELIQSMGHKISEMGKAVWNRVVLGHRTVQSFTLPDGSALDGKITINRKDALVSIAPGTVRTVGQRVDTKTGPTLTPAQTPVKINDHDYTQGKFISNGTTYNLAGPGIRLSNEARPNIETSDPFKVYVNGDGEGGETILGLGSVSPESRFKETTSGLNFRNMNGMWGLDANQSGTLNLNGTKIPITISDTGRLEKPIPADVLGSKVSQSIGGLVPNPETGGFQITGSAQIAPGEKVELGIPGIRPSQYTTGQMNDWRQETSVFIKQNGFEGRPSTEATLHQEGDKYVFTQGHVTFAAVTGPADGNKGQQTLYNEAVLSESSRLKIDGPTDFPNYDISVVAGNVSVAGNSSFIVENKTLYKEDGQDYSLTVKMNDRIVPIKVKSVDLPAGTFVAELPDMPLKDGEFVRPGPREVTGTIDFITAQATLNNMAVKAPLLKPRETPGMLETGPELTGNGYVLVKDNTISLNTDRLVNLDDYKNLEERKPIWTTTMNDRYATAMDAFINPDNTMVQRTGGLVLATAILPTKVVEDAVTFTVDSFHNAKDFSHHTFLAIHEPHAGDKFLETLKAVESGAEFAIRAEPGATLGVQTSRLAVKEGLSLAQQLAKNLREAKTSLNFQPLGESGHVAIPSSKIAQSSPREISSLKAEAVLGHYPEYIHVSDKIGGKRFNIPTVVWEKMSVSERWAANTKFLDRCIARGDTFVLATPIKSVVPGSYYQKELNYLFQKGYRLSDDARYLLPK